MSFGNLLLFLVGFALLVRLSSSSYSQCDTRLYVLDNKEHYLSSFSYGFPIKYSSNKTISPPYTNCAYSGWELYSMDKTTYVTNFVVASTNGTAKKMYLSTCQFVSTGATGWAQPIGLAYSPVAYTLLEVANNGCTQSVLYSCHTGGTTCTKKGNIGVQFNSSIPSEWLTCIPDLAVRPTDGVMFVVDLTTDILYYLSTTYTTNYVAAIAVGSLGVDIQSYAALDFDDTTNVLYLTANTSKGQEFFKLNTTSGHATLVASSSQLGDIDLFGLTAIHSCYTCPDSCRFGCYDANGDGTGECIDPCPCEENVTVCTQHGSSGKYTYSCIPWSCPSSEYDDGTTCNCACGSSDPGAADVSLIIH